MVVPPYFSRYAPVDDKTDKMDKRGFKPLKANIFNIRLACGISAKCPKA